LSTALVVGLFKEEEEGIGVASDVVKVKGEDPATSGYLRGDRARWYVDDQFRGYVLHGPPLRNLGTGTIPQYRFNKTKQHTLRMAHIWMVSWHKISAWNSNPKGKVCEQIVNFTVFYPDDGSSQPGHIVSHWTAKI